MAKTAIITGGTVGIGYELSKLIAADGYDLILVARNEKTLKSVKKEIESSYRVQVETLSADLSDPKAPKKIFDFAKKSKAVVEILVNNAGFGTSGRYDRMDLEKEMDMIQVNVTALAELTHRFLQGMVERKSGKILNVASTSSFQPGPNMANYYAGKAYVLSFSEAVYEDVKDDGVTVTVLCPGPTKTEFFERADITKSKLLNNPLAPMMSAQSVAKIGYDALKKGKPVVIAGIFNWLLAQSVRFTPRFVVRKIAKFINQNG
ncbi:SDR family oxidoreductase [Leptospira ellisii]|uniref:SDR family oxidoreductase n=1 Tax=Leptospira ellisii TaxID=2023197 RepID=A0AAE4QLX1_9LEPT|nr:SDR family oxidoreductase [Leptospira ellisii]MDV6235195.1 SDR family oxidoreductase [Leptospira ellisii]PKA04926.1 short-chain dehydrogenase [Leptospira ellisii]